MLFSILVASVLSLVIYYWFHKLKKPDNFPPGPFGFPLIGCLKLYSYPHMLVAFEDFHKKYGPVVGLDLGYIRCAVIGDYQVLKDLFSSYATSGRPYSGSQSHFRYEDSEKNCRGLAFSTGEEWKEQRRFTLKVLKDFGYGKSSIEQLINDQVVELNKVLTRDALRGNGVDLRYKFNISVINALWTLINGKALSLEDPELADLVKAVDELVAVSGTMPIMAGFKLFWNTFPTMTGWEIVRRSYNTMIKFAEATMRSHAKSFDATEEPSDYIDAYLKHAAQSAPGSSFHGAKGHQSLRSSLMDILMAGSETTSTFLNWAVLLMIKNPEMQRRVQSEIDSVCGKDRLPSLNDRGSLHYTEAVIHEISRFTAIVCLSIPHWVTDDIKTSDGRYHLPANTMIFPNLYHVMNNPEVFPNPRQFNPDRFIDTSGKFVKHEHNIVFGLGKRDCLGKSLGSMSVFLFFCGLFQKFSFSAACGDPKNLSLQPKWGFTLTPQPYKAVVTIR